MLTVQAHSKEAGTDFNLVSILFLKASKWGRHISPKRPLALRNYAHFNHSFKSLRRENIKFAIDSYAI